MLWKCSAYPVPTYDYDPKADADIVATIPKKEYLKRYCRRADGAKRVIFIAKRKSDRLPLPKGPAGQAVAPAAGVSAR